MSAPAYAESNPSGRGRSRGGHRGGRGGGPGRGGRGGAGVGGNSHQPQQYGQQGSNQGTTQGSNQGFNQGQQQRGGYQGRGGRGGAHQSFNQDQGGGGNQQGGRGAFNQNQGGGGRGGGQNYNPQNNYNNNSNPNQTYNNQQAGGGRGRGGFSHGGQQGGGGAGNFNQQRNQPYSGSKSGLTALEITDYPKDLQYQELVDFFNSNVGNNFRFVNLSFNYKPGHSKMQIQSGDANNVLALTGKFIRPNCPITIEHSTSGRPLQQAEKDMLRQFIKSRYNAQIKLLSLAGTITALQRVDFTNKMFLQEIGIIIAEDCPHVTTIDFSNNNLSMLTAFSRLNQYATHLRNISFMNNNIASMEQLEYLSGFRDTMNEIILLGNPCAASNIHPLLYHHLVSSIFPNLTMLDQKPVQQLIQFDLPAIKSSSSLPPSQGSFFEDQQSNLLAKEFVKMYYTLFDSQNINDRTKLHSVYKDNSLFSLNCAADVKFGMVSPQYSTLNRNMLALQPKNRAAQSASLLKTGNIDIVYQFKQLPLTRHDWTEFIMDVFFLPTAQTAGKQLFIGIKGTFLELESSTVRMFHRNFLCEPAGAEQSSKGWKIAIEHDQFFIGASKTIANNNINVANTFNSPQVNGLGGGLALELSGLGQSLSPEQQMITSLMQQTSVDQKTAILALQNTQGNYEQAVQMIQYVQQQQGMTRNN
jgi:hypothetical protein